EFSFADSEKAIAFNSGASQWKCTLADYACSKVGPAAAAVALRGGTHSASPSPNAMEPPSPSEFENNVVDGIAQNPSPQEDAARGGHGEPSPAGQPRVFTALPAFTPFAALPDASVRTSPDEKWE